MSIHYVQFTDESEASIKASFAGPQDSAYYPYQGEVEEDDPRYLTFLAAMTPTQLEMNRYERDRLLTAATLAIAPLQDAVDLEIATDEDVALLKKWKQYRVAVNRLDLTSTKIKWPAPPAS